MTVSGTVVNGVIVLHGGIQFPEGAHVRVFLMTVSIRYAASGATGSLHLIRRIRRR